MPFILALVNDERSAAQYSELASVSVGPNIEMAPGAAFLRRVSCLYCSLVVRKSMASMMLG